MADVRCADVLEWLRAAVLTKGYTPTPAIQAHVAGCASCQAALLLLASAAMETPVHAIAIDCASCLVDLPAFIEQEDEDPARVLRAFPHIWWHLWICTDCAEIYRMTRDLLAAERQGQLALPNIAAFAPPHVSQPQIVLRLNRQFLVRALPSPLQQARVMRGHREGPSVLSQQNIDSDRKLMLSVELQPPDSWLVRVTLTPPVSGWLVLSLGEVEFRARFEAAGVATVGGIPATLLAGADGPDLTVALDPNAEDQ